MNDRELIKRKEIDLELSDFLWEIVRNWRVLLVCMLIGAVLLGGYQYIKDSRSLQQTPEEVAEEFTQTIEDMEGALGAQDLDAVYGAVAIRKQLDEKSDYVKNSPLMDINPYEENVIYLQYCVRSGMENADEIATIYRNYILTGDISSELIDLGDERDTSTIIAASTYEYGFTVRIRGSREEECRELAEQVKNSLAQYETAVAGNLTEHELLLLNETSNVVVDQNLVTLQNGTSLAVKNLTEQLDNMKSKMTGDQLALYVEYTDHKEQESVSDENLNGEEANDVREVPEKQTQQVHFNAAKAVLGGVVGLALAIVWSLLSYLFMGKLRSEQEIKTLYHSNVLGTVRSGMRGKRNPIDQWIVGCRYRQSGKMSQEQELELISANINVACKERENKKVYLTGSAMEEIPEGMIAQLTQDCKKRGITIISGKEICYHADALEELSQIGQAVIIETVRKSRYTEMYQEVMRCREHHIEILGMVVVGV